MRTAAFDDSDYYFDAINHVNVSFTLQGSNRAIGVSAFGRTGDTVYAVPRLLQLIFEFTFFATATWSLFIVGAHKAGNVDAMFHLGRLLLPVRPVDRDHARAADLRIVL